MTNTPHRISTATRFRGRVLAAAVIGAVSMMSLTASAQQVAASAAQVPQLAMTQPAPAAAPSAAAPAAQDKLSAADAQLVPTVQTFETAPSIQPSVLDAPAAVSASAVVPSSAASTVAAAAAAQHGASNDDNVPWTLTAQTRPGVLQYSVLIPLNGLFFTLPSPQQARIMLPGNSADSAKQAGFIVSRYVTDNVGSAMKIRSRQLEALTNWIDDTNQKKAMLPKDPWAAYQFNKEALAAIQDFKQKVQNQTNPTLERMAFDIQSAVTKITPVMTATEGYDQKMQWYAVLLQLKEGVGIYQARVADADRQILSHVEAFERDNPTVPRPEGTAPAAPIDGRPVPPTPIKPMPQLTADAPREPAQPVAPIKQEQGNSGAGVIVLALMGLAVVGLFFKLRRRISRKGGSTEKSAK